MNLETLPPSDADYRELVIDHLIAVEHEQARRIADLEAERDMYQAMVRVLLDAHRRVGDGRPAGGRPPPRRPTAVRPVAQRAEAAAPWTH